MKVAVLGTGNVAHALAVHYASAGAEVRLCGLPERSQAVDAFPASGEIAFSGALGDGTVRIKSATTNLGQAISGSHLVVFAVPAYALATWYRAARPHLVDQTLLCIGCFALLRLGRMDPGLSESALSVVELATSPFPSRSFAPGSVELFGTRKVIPAASSGPRAAALVEQHFANIEWCEEPYTPGLQSTNPIIHAPMMLMNAGRIESSQPQGWNFFADGATPSVVQVVLQCDRERREICRRLGIATSAFGAGRTRDDAADPAGDLSDYLRNSPMHIDPRHSSPQGLAMRYLLEDVPFAIAPWTAFAARLGVATPALAALVHLYDAVRGRHGGHAPLGLQDLGLESLKAPAG